MERCQWRLISHVVIPGLFSLRAPQNPTRCGFMVLVWVQERGKTLIVAASTVELEKPPGGGVYVPGLVKGLFCGFVAMLPSMYNGKYKINDDRKGGGCWLKVEQVTNNGGC